MSNEVSLPGVNTMNTKLHKLRVFLSKPPKRTHTLIMTGIDAAAGTQRQLHEWERSEVVPELAEGILQRLDEHGEEEEASVVRAVLSYQDEGGKVLASMTLQKQRKAITDEAGFVAAQLAGDATSLVVAAQAQAFNMARLYMGGMAGVLATSERLSQRSEDRVEAMQRKLIKAEMEMEKLRAALAEAESFIAQGSSETEASPAQTEALGILKQLAPIIFAKLLQGGQVSVPAS